MHVCASMCVLRVNVTIHNVSLHVGLFKRSSDSSTQVSLRGHALIAYFLKGLITEPCEHFEQAYSTPSSVAAVVTPSRECCL